MASKYSDDLIAVGLARCMAGEPISVVARDLEPVNPSSLRVRLSQELAKQRAVITPAPQTLTLRNRMHEYLDESLQTLTAHVRLYRDPTWIAEAGPAATLEATRTVGARLVTVIDRLGGHLGTDDDSEG